MTGPAKDVVQRKQDGDRTNQNASEVSRQQSEDKNSKNDPDGEAREKDRHIATVVNSPKSPRNPKISMKHKIGSISAAACSGDITSEKSGNAIPPKSPGILVLEMPVSRTTGIAIA